MERFVQAESIFYHHIVFNPTRQACELLLDSSHHNCHPDIFERVLDSLGIVNASSNKSKVVDVESGDMLDLHATATLTTSFLGVVPAPEIASGIHDGSISPRTLRSVSGVHSESDEFRSPSSPTAYQRQRSSANYSSSSRHDNSAHVPLTDDGLDDEDVDGDAAASSQATADVPRPRPRQEPRKPSPEELKRRMAGQAKKRDSTFKSLLTMYSSTSSELQVTPSKSKQRGVADASSRLASQPTPPKATASWLLERVSATPSDNGSGSSASKKRKLVDDSVGPISSSRMTSVTSFQDLVNKNRAISEPALVSPPLAARSQQRPSPTTTRGSTTPSSKNQRTPGGVATLATANKSAKAAKKSTANGSTLLQFFQKK